MGKEKNVKAQTGRELRRTRAGPQSTVLSNNDITTMSEQFPARQKKFIILFPESLYYRFLKQHEMVCCNAVVPSLWRYAEEMQVPLGYSIIAPVIVQATLNTASGKKHHKSLKCPQRRRQPFGADALTSCAPDFCPLTLFPLSPKSSLMVAG